MKAELITIGDEILIGQVVDTNSAYLAEQLHQLGIPVTQITSVADTRDAIIRALDEAVKRADIIITTGGLGPTNDDITKHTMADYFHTRLVMNPFALKQIKILLSSRGVEVNNLNIQQAELPENCEILPNRAGTAQGMWFIKNGVHIISLPGVPYEMKGIFNDEIIHRVKERFSLPALHHITILTHGIPESVMSQKISNWESALPEHIRLAYLPSPGILRLRLTGISNEEMKDLQRSMEEEVDKLKRVIGSQIFGYNKDKLEEITVNLLINSNITVSTAESCTGGNISGMITSVPGSSACFKGSVVAYSNEIKISVLGVRADTIQQYGAVSQQVVEEMATGIKKLYNTDLSVAVSGIAGPSGGTEEKPVGTTWIAVAGNKKITSRKFNFGEHRGRNMQKASVAALFMLKTEVENEL